jgi:hypothetical protein
VAFYPENRLKLQQFFQQCQVAGFKFHHQAAGAAGQHMGMGCMPGNKSMLAVFFHAPSASDPAFAGF